MENNATFLKTDSKLGNYMAYPKFLNELPLNDTAKHIYVLLLNRARLSMKEGWADQEGNVFVLYSLSNLAKDSGKTTRTVKHVLNRLQEANLILREQRIPGKTRKIYIKTWETSFPKVGKEISTDMGKLFPTNKKDKYKIIDSKYICGEDESL